MATYKVIQDIEAEDKLVGPLTLRQFIYAAITAVCMYLCFIALTKSALFLIPIFFPVGALSGFFAFPWGREQPTEIWALAKIRFLIKPRRRIWDQSGVKELVTITAPKTIDINYTNGLSQIEVKSRLKALADTIDTRGWATKNVLSAQLNQPMIVGGTQNSDRLIDISNLPQEVSTFDVRASDDILDEQNNRVASTFDSMIQKSDQAHRDHIQQSLSQAQELPGQQAAETQPQRNIQTSGPLRVNDYWFLGQTPTMSAHTQVVTPGASSTDLATNAEPTADERALAERLRKQSHTQDSSYSHLHTILPLSEQQALAQKAAREAAAAKRAQAPMTRQPDPAIIALATNNDLNVATIARQANKQTLESPDEEVVISLH